MSVLQRCPSYRESNKRIKESQGPALVSVLQRCPSYRESNKGSKESQGSTLSVRFREVSVKRESTVVPKSLSFRSLERERNGKREILGSRLE